MKLRMVLAVFLLSLIGCTNAELAQVGALGSAAHVKCWSGGVVIYEGDSTGKVASESASDGWYFEDVRTGDLVRVSGQCLITVKK